MVDNLKKIDKLIVLSYQLINECHIIWNYFLNKKFRMDRTIMTCLCYIKSIIIIIIMARVWNRDSIVPSHKNLYTLFLAQIWSITVV